MIKAAITGNIASGKSEAEKILIEKGFKVIDCDKINAELLNNNAEVKREIKKTFGGEVFSKEGGILKQKLGEIVFNNPEKKRQLEAILHKRILYEIYKFFDENKNEKIVFVSAALLFEAGFQDKFDKIIFISADEKIRLERLMKRNNLTKEQALSRIKAQENEQKKVNRADFVICNNSDAENLKNSISCILKKIQIL